MKRRLRTGRQQSGLVCNRGDIEQSEGQDNLTCGGQPVPSPGPGDKDGRHEEPRQQGVPLTKAPLVTAAVNTHLPTANVPETIPTSARC